MSKTIEKQKMKARAPVIVIMGHIDHGKSTLLDHIRKSNVVAGEAGGITQRISAYEVKHKKEGKEYAITFLDTPGHAAFSGVREQGVRAADIAILIVSAEDGVKAQTLEALESIKSGGIPFLVAINKIDKPGADVERTKQSLAQNNIFLEGYGGDVPAVSISAKTGEGVPELLDMILLIAEMAELRGEEDKPAEGVVIEANRDPKKGISAALVIKDGTLKSGMYVVVGDSLSPVRIMENFLGQKIKKASFSSPVQVIGFDKIPETGLPFKSFADKKEAEAERASSARKTPAGLSEHGEGGKHSIPLLIKADTVGTLAAVKKEIEKMEKETEKNENRSGRWQIINTGVGNISENDINLAKGGVVAGFNTKPEPGVAAKAEALGVEIETFDIIYNLTKWLEGLAREKEPVMEVAEIVGEAKILKFFSLTGKSQVVGARAEKGKLSVGEKVKIERGVEAVGEGTVLELQRDKVEIKSVSEGSEFGAKIKTEVPLKAGDVIRVISVTLK